MGIYIYFGFKGGEIYYYLLIFYSKVELCKYIDILLRNLWEKNWWVNSDLIDKVGFFLFSIFICGLCVNLRYLILVFFFLGRVMNCSVLVCVVIDIFLFIIFLFYDGFSVKLVDE